MVVDRFFLTFIISFLFLGLFCATLVITAIASSKSSFISSLYDFHDLSLDFFAISSAFFSIISISLFEAKLFSIIHSLILLIQQKSFSQFNLSFDLYLSWDPDVVCPWGWVTSFT